MTATPCLACNRATEVEVGALCRPCANQVAPCDGLIADHVKATVAAAAAAGWVVDGFGTAHPLAARSTLGRSHDGQLVILASSVSREHARLELSDGVWHVRDLGSRNGTFVDEVRLQGRAALPPRARLRVGDVALWFLAHVAYRPSAELIVPSLATATAGGGLVRYTIAPAEGATVELCVVGTTEPGAGGALLARPDPDAPWVERSLAPLEFQLLRALCARRLEEAGSPSAVRGCVATKQLARDLPFQSRFANEENVRQVVRRLRGVLDEVGAAGAVAVAPGRGYYLVGPVRE